MNKVLKELTDTYTVLYNEVETTYFTSICKKIAEDKYERVHYSYEYLFNKDNTTINHFRLYRLNKLRIDNMKKNTITIIDNKINIIQK